MRGSDYKEGLTFRRPALSNLRAEYAASLRDAGLSYSAIAWALGLHGKRRRAFQVVQYGRRLRDAALVAKVKDTYVGATLDAGAISAVEMYRYLQLSVKRLYYTEDNGTSDTPNVAPNYYGPLCDALRDHKPRVDPPRHTMPQDDFVNFVRSGRAGGVQ